MSSVTTLDIPVSRLHWSLSALVLISLTFKFYVTETRSNSPIQFLVDLYGKPGKSAGVGNWDFMGKTL
jgi:hypothetical protein